MHAWYSVSRKQNINLGENKKNFKLVVTYGGIVLKYETLEGVSYPPTCAIPLAFEFLHFLPKISCKSYFQNKAVL